MLFGPFGFFVCSTYSGHCSAFQKAHFFPHKTDIHRPLLNQFQNFFFLSSFLQALQGLKNGRDLELRLAEPRSSFSLPLPIRLIPKLKVWDLKFYNRKTEDSSQSIYRRLFLHCGHCEKCFLDGMGLLAAVGTFFHDGDLRDPLLNQFQKKRRAGARLVVFFGCYKA